MNTWAFIRGHLLLPVFVEPYRIAYELSTFM